MNDFEVIQFKNDSVEISVNVSPEEDTVWLTTEQMAVLYGVDRTRITRHINNIYNDKELDRKSTCAENAHMGSLGIQKYVVKLYNLDMIISVGYRVKSKNAIAFRKWANTILREYLLKGYVINDNRTLVTNENYVNLINKVNSIDIRLKNIENNELNYKKEKLISNGEVFDSISYLENIASSANSKVLLIDPYVDSKALNILKNVKEIVSVRIITSNKAKLSNIDINAFTKQYNISVDVRIDDDFHDRYLYIDDRIFHMGSSINYLGNKISQINEVLDKDIKEYLMERVEY